MKGEPLDELYFKWLYEQVCVRRAPKRRSYWSILRHLFAKEFVWIVPNDDNRMEDGRDLRAEFAESQGVRTDQEWMTLGCSMLELLIGLARRLAFETDMSSEGWFWRLMQNLGLADYTDMSHISPEEVNCILDTVIWRTYAYDGTGGIFPLARAARDQRKVEIWYQLSAYLLEQLE
jgi:hypothetical protein